MNVRYWETSCILVGIKGDYEHTEKNRIDTTGNSIKFISLNMPCLIIIILIIINYSKLQTL